MDKITDNFVLQRSRIVSRDLIFFTAYNHELALEEVPHGVLFFLKNQTDWNFSEVAWSMVSIDACMEPSLQCFVLGRDGEVFIGSKAGFAEERIDNNGTNPTLRGPLQNIRIIEDTAFAIGMGRQVYRRLAPEQWTRFEVGIPDAPPSPAIVGFNAIAGQSLKELYAVGWAGEIWRHDGQLWSPLDSPTNLLLHDVLMLPDQSLYACGQEGTLLRGKGHQWERVSYNGPDSDWRTIAWFDDRLFLADGANLYTLKGNTVLPVQLDQAGPAPVISLHATGELLLASTADSAFMTNDGDRWTTLPC